MSESDDDGMFGDLSLDRDETKKKLGWGLVTPDVVEDPAELEVYCRARREEPRGAHEVMFTVDELGDDGEPTGVEIWDEVEGIPGQSVGKRIGQAERWAKIMEWPEGARPPTPADVELFLRHVNAVATATLWYEVEAFRSKQEQPAGAPIKVPGANTPAEPGMAPTTPPKGFRIV